MTDAWLVAAAAWGLVLSVAAAYGWSLRRRLAAAEAARRVVTGTEDAPEGRP